MSSIDITTPALDPLPQRFLTDEPGIGGVIKARPEDFLVEELPLYQPLGEGEHLYLFVEKNDVSHAEMISSLRRHFGVREEAIGFAGMKDKLGITRQMVSIHLLGDPTDLQPPHERIRVLWSARHRNKLRRGHLEGNRFSIRIRDVDPLKAPHVKRILARLQRDGVPNYFGFQRFGYRRNNHLLGAAMLRGQWDALLAELLGTTGSAFPEYQRQRRELFDAGRYAEAAPMWTTADRAELFSIRALTDGKNPQQACRAIGKTSLSFFISALQSAIFNRVLDQRLEAGTLLTLMEGDVAWKHGPPGSGSVFAVTAAELATGALPPRMAAFEISPSGPLWGRGRMSAAGEVDRMELAALDAAGLTEQAFIDQGVEGGRRPLRVRISNPEVDAGVDEHGGYVRLAFDLPRGAYATVVLREIMKTEMDQSAGEP